ncbi:MAG TPA: ATP-binding cassette domain-containing protein, partial [Cyclobacteriaceae bacterium]|nr:ATP-binding cassette domain-containing protein [Cyclobacteriaceae bacterium]
MCSEQWDSSLTLSMTYNLTPLIIILLISLFDVLLLNTMINVSNLKFSYTQAQSISFPDFSLNKGEHCLLLGESGSGKTTLLHVMGGLLRGYSGTLQLAGTELVSLSEGALDKFRGKNIGFIFQK